MYCRCSPWHNTAMAKDKIQQWAGIATIATFAIYLMTLIIGFVKPSSSGSWKSTSTWIMPGLVVSVFLLAAILNFLTHRRISRVEREIPSFFVDNLPIDGPAKAAADRAKRSMENAEHIKRSLPSITKLADQIEYGNGSVSYPLKLRIQFRNDSGLPADIQMHEYQPEMVKIKGFPAEVLQLRIKDAWLPSPHGVGRIAVYPGQQFQAWIGLDDGLYSRAQVEGRRGNMGRLIFLVNGEHVAVNL